MGSVRPLLETVEYFSVTFVAIKEQYIFEI